MEWIEFIEGFEEIETFLQAIYEENAKNVFEEDINISRDLIEVPVRLLNEKIKLHISHLNLLQENKQPDNIPSFKYLDDFGVKFKKYHEIAISISSDDYNWFEGEDWNTSPLKFKIGETQYEVSLISPLMVLLTEPVYGDRDWHYDFNQFASIKMVVQTGTNFKDEFSKAVYYLNSHYLKKIGFYAKLKRLTLGDEDPLGLFSGEDPEEIFKVAKRIRNRKRDNFISVIPINLYNAAFRNTGTFRFLSFYRVLEFFMEQALIERAKTLRKDNTVSEIELIKELSIHTEKEQLINLCKSVTTPYKKGRMMGYCMNKGIIGSREFKKIPVKLYRYRNSLVHAKEKKIIETNIPTPFESIPNDSTWIYIVEELARECMNKLNKKTSD